MHVLTAFEEMSNYWILCQGVRRCYCCEETCVVYEEGSVKPLIYSSLFSVEVGGFNREYYHTTLLFNMPCSVWYHPCTSSHSRGTKALKTLSRNVRMLSEINLFLYQRTDAFSYLDLACNRQTQYLLAICCLPVHSFLKTGLVCFGFAAGCWKWICKAIFSCWK